jgi:hypothetical protein
MQLKVDTWNSSSGFEMRLFMETRSVLGVRTLALMQPEEDTLNSSSGLAVRVVPSSLLTSDPSSRQMTYSFKRIAFPTDNGPV